MATRTKEIELPHSEEAEKGALSSLLQAPGKAADVMDRLKPEDMFVPAHSTILSNLYSMYEQGKPIDLILFTEYLKKNSVLKEIGGPSVLTSIYNFVPAPTNLACYIAELKELKILRDMIALGHDTIRKATAERSDVKSLLASTQVAFSELKHFDILRKKTLLEHINDKIERMEQGEPDADRIATNLQRLDELSPLRQGDMPVITGERKMGKSIFGLSLFENICLTTQRPGLWFSLEDRTPKIVDRLMAGVSRIPIELHHAKKLNEEELYKITQAANRIGGSKMTIEDSLFDIHSIIATARKFVLDNPDTVIIGVDYTQLVEAVRRKSDTRESEVASVSRSFRKLAMSTNIPVLIISQLNEDGRTRESRALEQDATANWNLIPADDPGQRLVSIPWQRNGPSGEAFPVTFLGPIARVENAAQEI